MNGTQAKADRAPSPQRRYHFHTPGALYIVVTLFLAIGALNSQNNLLFASLGLAIGGLLVSGLVSGGSLMGVRIEREAPGRARVGDRIAIHYRVRNRNLLLPAFGLTLTELESGGGRPSWRAAMGTPRAFVPYVPARGHVEAVASIEVLKRGRVTFGRTRAWTTFPFGLAKKSVTVSQASSVVIHPVALPVRIGVLERLTIRSMAGMGSAVEAGAGDELYGLREYNEGDNPRWIAWRPSARTGQLLVRQNTTPTPRKVWIVLRLAAGASEPERELAIAMASALVRACAAEGAAVGLAVPGADLAIPPRNSGRSVRVMLEQLAELDSDRATGGDFPAGAVRAGANVVIHGGEIDRSFGSARTVHIGPGTFERHLVHGQDLDRAMSLLRRSNVAPGHEKRRSRWTARLLRRGGTR